jgi:hypothetical protein
MPPAAWEHAARVAEQAAQAAGEKVLAGDPACTADCPDGDCEDFCQYADYGPCCDTCVVRDVLDAAWPHMVDLARALPEGHPALTVAPLAGEPVHD